MRRHSFSYVTAAALVLALGACRDSAGPGSGDESAVFDDVIAQAGLPGSYLNPEGEPARVPCTYSATSQRFECPTVSRGGVTMKRSFAFFDASGASQHAFDPVATEAVNTRSSIDGTRTDPGGRFTSEVHLASDMTVSGLAGRETEHTLNGTSGGTTVTTAVTERGTFRTASEVADTTSGLVFPLVDRRQSSALRPVFPKAGSIVHVMRVTTTDPQGRTRTSFLRAKTTFDGTETVRVEITTELGTRTCTRSLVEPVPLSCT